MDTILESIKEQGKKLTTLEEKGGWTLESMENFERRLELIESKVSGMEQVISQENSQLKSENMCSSRTFGKILGISLSLFCVN